MEQNLLVDTHSDCEIVGIFKSIKNLEDAVDELNTSGFDRADLSVLADEANIKDKFGDLSDNAKQLAKSPNTPRIAYPADENIGAAQGGIIGGLMYVGTLAASSIIIAAGGAIATAIAGAAVVGGAGTLIGTALSKFIGKTHAQYLEKQLANGGLLLWAHYKSPEQKKLAKEIMLKNQAIEVYTHESAEELITS